MCQIETMFDQLDKILHTSLEINDITKPKTMNIVSDSIYNDPSNISIDGIVKEILFDDRYYLHTIPKNVEDIHDLIVFYHGSRDIAWMQILEYTNLCSIDQKYLIAFGQASGIISKPEIHPDYGYASFGEIFWEIRHDHQQLTEDILYTRALIGDMKDQYSINNVYFIGHSNGGVFALLLALYTPNMFKGIVSHMGGIGYDPGLYLNFNLMQNNDARTPILFYTGENDLHKIPCESAYSIFLNEDFPVKIMIEKDIGHEYLLNCEEHILNWFESIDKI